MEHTVFPITPMQAIRGPAIVLCKKSRVLNEISPGSSASQSAYDGLGLDDLESYLPAVL